MDRLGCLGFSGVAENRAAHSVSSFLSMPMFSKPSSVAPIPQKMIFHHLSSLVCLSHEEMAHRDLCPHMEDEQRVCGGLWAGGDPSWSTDSSTKIPSLLWKGDGEGREDVDVVWALWGLWRMKTVGS